MYDSKRIRGAGTVLVQMIRTNTGQCQMENLRTNDLKLLQGEGIVW